MQSCHIDVYIYINISAPFQSPAPEFNYFEVIIMYITNTWTLKRDVLSSYVTLGIK